ncbi:helix-turn-helix domain-containing protein [Erythrobacter ani]|uniref:Helix-turn-helix transcriptional regulator n=1 Tax=Erythrobacter ani TaxID=2827235 RepID=A0ABS6SNS7_9SPHN|nr:AraC family transcriptional regulator [Erythrobacter ani]MBV7266680.1 helix-turn-helix transcriptional regulator [Erythrobacter ani]
MLATDPNARRNEATGYWGRELCRKAVAKGIFQLHEANAPPEAVNPHGHTHAHIVFVTSGPYVTPITGENGFIDRPVAVLNPPGTYHRDHFVTGRGSFMAIDLNIEGLAENHVRHALSAPVLQFCHRLARDLNAKTAFELEDDLAALATLFECERPQDLDGIPAGIERAFDAIRQSGEPWALTMADLARIADVHPNHLPRAFRTRFGCSPSQMANARQIELCAVAVTACDEPLVDLAARFGFYDQAHMSARFRKAMACSPAQWRLRNRGQG